MRNVRSLSLSVWECKYHIVIIPKYRRKSLYSDLRKQLGAVFRDLARQRESEVEEGHSTVGRDEATIRRYIREQETEDQRLEQLSLE